MSRRRSTATQSPDSPRTRDSAADQPVPAEEAPWEPIPSPHGEAAEEADPWVAERYAEHKEIDARLNAIPDEDLNPAKARELNPQAGVL